MMSIRTGQSDLDDRWTNDDELALFSWDLPLPRMTSYLCYSSQQPQQRCEDLLRSCASGRDDDDDNDSDRRFLREKKDMQLAVLLEVG